MDRCHNSPQENLQFSIYNIWMEKHSYVRLVKQVSLLYSHTLPVFVCIYIPLNYFSKVILCFKNLYFALILSIFRKKNILFYLYSFLEMALSNLSTLIYCLHFMQFLTESKLHAIVFRYASILTCDPSLKAIVQRPVLLDS